MAEPLRLHQPLDLHRADARHAANVVAPQIDQHGVLGAFLRVGAELLLEAEVLFLRRASTAGAGDGPHGHLGPFDLDEQLRRSAEQLATAEPQVEVVRRGAGGAQRPVEGKAVAIGQLESLREDHLEDVAGADVLQRAPDRGLELLLPAGHRHRFR